MTTTRYRNDLLKIYQAALTRVCGYNAVRRQLEETPLQEQYRLVAIGKAAAAMTRGALEAGAEKINEGLVITKTGYMDNALRIIAWLQCLESEHPVPGENSLVTGRFLVDFLRRSPSSCRFLFLISGGTSSLVEVLPQSMTLDMLQRVNNCLIRGGMGISEMNRIRSAISLIKGGRLIPYLRKRPTIALYISDVPNDDPAIIGSGLLVPPDTISSKLTLPADISSILGKIALPAESALSSPPSLVNYIVATLEDAKHAAAVKARELGYAVIVHSEFLRGDPIRVAAHVVAKIRESVPGIHIWGGETSVKLPETCGRGGRNQHLALALALESKTDQGMLILAAGTDGTDGPTKDAGGLIDGETLQRADRLGLDGQQYLKNADSGRFLQATGDVLTTGPTGTNVMDLVIGLKMFKDR